MKRLVVFGLILLLSVFVGYVYDKTLTNRDQQSEVSEAVQQPTIPADWETYKSPRFKYSVNYPKDFEVTQNGEYSIMVVKKVSQPGQGPTNFIYISVVPPGAQDIQGVIYNYTKNHTDTLREMRSNENKVLPGESPELAEYVTYTRLPDTTISGKVAKTFINVKPWEFPAGTKEIRYIIDIEDTTYILGGYISTTSHNGYTIADDLYNNIISTITLAK